MAAMARTVACGSLRSSSRTQYTSITMGILVGAAIACQAQGSAAQEATKLLREKAAGFMESPSRKEETKACYSERGELESVEGNGPRSDLYTCAGRHSNHVG